MSFGFLNAAMLVGLSAMALPVIAHLLSKRKYDVVQWGAMQFLELGQKTRRRIRLQDLLLLLMRMAAVGIVALAIARPWGRGGVFGELAGAVSRDVVFIVDGSYSMGWEGGTVTPHSAAVQWVHDALEELGPGDTATVIDAREVPRRIIDPPTTDLARAREVVDGLADPTGSSDLPAAILEGMQVLSSTTNAAREVIVLTDQQRLPWRIDDEFLWTRIDEFEKQPSVAPTVSVVNVSENTEERTNFALDRLQLSRELTVPDFPIRIRGVVRQSGGKNTDVRVRFEVNGQPVPEKVRDVQLLANGEAIVELEHRFDDVGSYLVSLSIDRDHLPADNRAEAVVRVADGIPVLIVDGDPNLDETRGESFFVKAALDSSGRDAPWVRATTIPLDQLNADALQTPRVVFLCNVPKLSSDQAAALTSFVSDGGGLIIAPGDHTDAPAWNQLTAAETVPFLPARLDRIRTEQEIEGEAVTVNHLSLKQQWLERFRKDAGVDFCETRFSRWFLCDPAAAPEDDENAAADGAAAAAREASVSIPRAEVLARLTSGDPLMISQRRGDGQIILLSVPLDADWSTLPARNDYVPFLHEMVFLMTSAVAPRNVELGAPLLLALDEEQMAEDLLVRGPGIEEDVKPENYTTGRLRMARFGEAKLPGLYRFVADGQQDKPDAGEPFVVNMDREESNLSPVTPADWERLAANDRLIEIETMRERTRQLKNSQSRAELWWGLLIFVVALLVCEVALTRRMVLGGHTALDPADATTGQAAKEGEPNETADSEGVQPEQAATSAL